MDYLAPTLILVLIYCVSSNGVQENELSPELAFDRYHDYDEMTDFLRKFTEEHKQYTRLYSIGRSIQKRELWVVEVYNRVQPSHIGVPHVKVIGNIHGNEPAGREIVLHLIEYLVKGFIDGDRYIQWLLNSTSIHLMPSMNPDGFEVAREGVCGPGSRGRENSRGVDLNRNFPDHFRRNTMPVQPETASIKRWLANNTFVLSASLHGGSMVANYPFDNTPEDSERFSSFAPSPTPDDDVFHYLATLYARVHPTMHLGIPCNEGVTFKNGAVNGASWYPLIGGMQDFNYAKHGCMEITLEISCCRYPQAKEIKQIWEENRQALLTYISQAHRGIRGVVRSKDGKPISNAVLRILGRNMTFNTSRNGEFWRILLPANYMLQVEASGFVDKLIPFEVPKVENETAPVHLWLDLTLERETKNSGSGSKTVCPHDKDAADKSCAVKTNSSSLSSSSTSSSNPYTSSTRQSFSVEGTGVKQENDSSTTEESIIDIHLVVVNEVRSNSLRTNFYSIQILVLLLYLWLVVSW